MQYAARITAALLALALLLPLSLFIGYDLSAFQSRKGKISALISQATPDETHLSPPVARLIHVSADGNTAARSARILIDDLHIPPISKGPLG